ncbi:MAG: histidinol-phosphate transaminase, partial [Lentisphaeria bacterium]|nr:histidinol-phosphate transaminase [Lentisphaeria bacterium]
MSEQEYISYFRQEIDAMSGYAPGEQPKDFDEVIKLNTNECPYPPAPGVKKVLEDFDPFKLRLYPDPVSQDLRKEFGAMNGYSADHIMTGNGSDDLLTIITRCFTDREKALVCFDPSYSLYPTLAKLQGAECIRIPLTENFDIPENVLDLAQKGNLFFIARPNAPTGNLLSKDAMHHICRNFKGIVVIDEAYADFSEDNCMDFVKLYSNVIITRTFSKSRSLAGLRFSFAVAHPKIIDGMMKMKDSYNVSMLTQKVAMASLKDNDYFTSTVRKVCRNREILAESLHALGFEINPSQANFLFAKPPVNAENYFNGLKKHNI